MSDSDSEYEDLVENVGREARVGDVESVKGPKKNAAGKPIRGPDKSWEEIEQFEDVETFKDSEIFTTIKREFTKRKSCEYEYADVIEYSCKFARRTGFLPCPWTLRVLYPSHNREVRVESVGGVESHEHREDPDNIEEESSNFRWSEEMTRIVEDNIHLKPNIILRKLKDANVHGRKLPTRVQLYNKISATKKAANNAYKITNTHELRQALAPLFEAPASDIEAFVPFCDIEDHNDKEDPRVSIIFTTKRNMEKMKDERVIQTDATYRLLWLDYPVFVVGTSSPTGKFFGTCAVISSHEDTPAWSSIFNYLRDYGLKPRYSLGDGAKAMSKAGNESFVNHTFSRLMCWSHVHRNIVPQLKSIATIDRLVSDKILKDIIDIQWCALNDATFKKLFELLKIKYLENEDQTLSQLIDKFFCYMHKVWIDSNESKWYEGAHPWGVSNNQGNVCFYFHMQC